MRKPLRRAARRSRAECGWAGPLPDRDPQGPARSEAQSKRSLLVKQFFVRAPESGLTRLGG